jgi:hypothetical protein
MEDSCLYIGINTMLKWVPCHRTWRVLILRTVMLARSNKGLRNLTTASRGLWKSTEIPSTEFKVSKHTQLAC